MGAGPVGTGVAAGAAVPDVCCCVVAFDAGELELAGLEGGDAAGGDGGAAAADVPLPANDDHFISVQDRNDRKDQLTS